MELGVGTGRVALPLAARGTAVTGIDASERMLARLRAKPGGDAVRTVIGDLAEASGPGGPFALVYVVFNTFFMLLDQETQVRCFASVAAALRPGGLFVIEAFVPDQSRYDHGQRVDVVELTETSAKIDLAIHDAATQRVRGRHLFFAGSDVKHGFPLDLRYAWPSELTLMGRLAGLELSERWGDWSGQAFTATSAGHVSVWRKPAA